eukprot:8478041-Karenia_brevis.AAC.1
MEPKTTWAQRGTKRPQVSGGRGWTASKKEKTEPNASMLDELSDFSEEEEQVDLASILASSWNFAKFRIAEAQAQFLQDNAGDKTKAGVKEIKTLADSIPKELYAAAGMSDQ